MSHLRSALFSVIVLAVVLEVGCHAGGSGDAPPARLTPGGGEGQAPGAPDLDPAGQVLRQLFGDLVSESQEARLLPAPFWARTGLFQVVNYTWPHCPGAKVALTDEGRALVLSGLSDGLGDDAPMQGFNLVARAEGRRVRPEEAGDYLRFVLSCYVGCFEPERFRPDLESARRIARGSPRPEDLAENFPPADVTRSRYRLEGFYADHRGVVHLHFTVDPVEGQVAVEAQGLGG